MSSSETPTTFNAAIENAARLLRLREDAMGRTYGRGSTVEAIELAAGWSDLARALAVGDNRKDT